MERVVVTGLGAITAIGATATGMFRAAVEGRSGVRAAPDLAIDGTVPLVAAADFDAAGITLRQRGAALDRGTALALAAARQAIADAHAEVDPSLSEAGIYWGTCVGGLATLEQGYRTIFGERRWRIKPTMVVSVMNNAPAACISIDTGATGPTITYSVACASSAVAIGEAATAIRAGRIDTAIAGGSDAMLTRPSLCAWSALHTLAAPDPADASHSCKPFSAHRSGFVLGEGAAAVLLESGTRAAARGARIYGELAGYGIASDAAHLVDPSTEGQGRAILAALQDARIHPGEVDYINAHGTATMCGDRAEVQSIRNVFADHAQSMPVSSTKALHGHAMGATGAIEFIVTLLAVHFGVVPPTAHLDVPDADLDAGMDLIRGRARRSPSLRAALSHSFAFGGTNVVLAVRRWPRSAGGGMR